MQVMTDWKNLTDEELVQIKKSLDDEFKKRKQIENTIKDFLFDFRRLEALGVTVSIYEGVQMTLYKEDFHFESVDGSKEYNNY